GDMDRLRRRIREEEPVRPSARVASLEVEGPGSGTDVAKQRGTQPGALSKSLHGDLDWIVLKALAKDRARRYATPDDLAADSGRYLKNEPISARPPSLTYQFRKFARRNRWVVTGVAGFLFVLASGAVVSTVMYLRAEESRREATAVAQFLGGML